MTLLDRALGVAVRLVPVEAEARSELAADAGRLARERGCVAGLGELGAVLLLALELHAGAGRSGRGAVLGPLRRGAWLAAEVLLLHAGILVALAAVEATGPVRSVGGGALPLTLAGLLLAAVTFGRARPALARPLALIAGVALAALLAGAEIMAPPGTLSMLAAGLAGIAFGRPCGSAVAPTVALLVVIGTVLGGAELIGGPEVAAVAARWSTVAALLALLAGAQGDPALGLAGAFVAAWRFVVVDPSGLIDLAAAMVRTGPSPDLVLRGLAMAVGLGVAVAVAHRGLRQAATI